MSISGPLRDERTVYAEMQAQGELAFFDVLSFQIVNLDQKAQAIVNLEGLLLALMAVFATIIPSESGVRIAAWFSMILTAGSALCSIVMLRVRWGTKMMAKTRSIEEGLLAFQAWRDLKLKLHKTSLALLSLGLLGLMAVLTLVLLR